MFTKWIPPTPRAASGRTWLEPNPSPMPRPEWRAYGGVGIAPIPSP